MRGNAINVGMTAGSKRQVTLSAEARARHVYVAGGTGVGKSKFLEHCIREDILNWRDSKCGLLLLDPHGLVYDNTLAWLARHNLKRPIIPIDLRRNDSVVAYNPLRKRADVDPAVVVGGFVRALAHVWGESGTDATPLFARWASAILLTLYTNGYTIGDVVHLLSREDIRRAMIANVTDDMTRYTWRKAEKQPKDFERDVMSTVNRFNRLVGTKVMRSMLGEARASLDLRTALDEGSIILVNLATEGGQIDEEDADTFATLLLTDLWAAARDRGKSARAKPFYIYVDECQKFITPTIADNLDQSRGFGLHFTLANQYPSRFLHAGPSGRALYDSIIANATSKIIFRLEHPDDAMTLGTWLFMNSFNTDEVKHTLFATKVLGYRKEERKSETVGSSRGRSSTTGSGGGQFMGLSKSEGEGGSSGEDEDVESWNRAVGGSSGSSESWSNDESTSETESESVTTSTVDVPIIGKEVSSVQFRPVDEQIFRAMQTLFDQRDRHFAIRFHEGPCAPLFVRTPNVSTAPVRKERVEEYRQACLSRLPYVFPMSEASKRLVDRERLLLIEILDANTVDEPLSAGRRIDPP